jgi:hypothetical protein
MAKKIVMGLGFINKRHQGIYVEYANGYLDQTKVG